MDVLATLIDGQDLATAAAELGTEVGHLTRSQAELRAQLESLLERRQSLARGASPDRRALGQQFGVNSAADKVDGVDGAAWFAAVDVEQLERRRHELEEERFGLVNQLAALDRKLRDLKAQRATVDRQRASLLSARSIEHVQRELADVERKLQQSAAEAGGGEIALNANSSPRASDFIAKLTDGRLVRLELVDRGRSANVWSRDGSVLALDALSPAERDQVYLSLSLALVSAAGSHSARLPLVLDEPFLRLNSGDVAAMAAVLDDLSRQGQQVLVFTGQTEAVERLTSLGAAVYDLVSLQRRPRDSGLPIAPVSAELSRPTSIRPVAAKKPIALGEKATNGKRPKKRRSSTSAESPTSDDRSDAA
jgi:uncharacterized protein YhaN